jgi:CRISPR-associated endoribonuclease Cas6
LYKPDRFLKPVRFGKRKIIIMRFKINLEIAETQNRILPINYQYEVAGWIYKTLEKGNKEYASWLHTNGFAQGSKQFRLFTFSHFDVVKKKIMGDRIQINDPIISLQLSFLPEKSTEEFIKGVFAQQQFVLGDSKSRVMFRVAGIELMPQPTFANKMVFETLSPLTVAIKNDEGKPHFIEPCDPRMEQALYKNLCQKYLAYYVEEFEGGADVKFELLSTFRKRGIAIKAGTPQQTKVIGYTYRFALTAPTELLKIGYAAGFGEKNSMGFGCVGVVKT